MYEKNKVLHDLALTYIYILFNQLEHFFLRKNSIDVHQDNVALYPCPVLSIKEKKDLTLAFPCIYFKSFCKWDNRMYYYIPDR